MSTRRAFLLVLALVAAQYVWNAAAQRAFWGYDEGGHAGYALSIREELALPHPLSGWSSFHPPLAHVFAAATWSLLEPLGPRAALVGVRLPSLLGVLVAGLAVFALARRLTGSERLAAVAATLTLSVPVAQLSATMIGNEGLGAGLAALALCALVPLQTDPRRVRLALAAGLCAGLAAATKYTGLWSVAACALPFLRLDLDRRGLRAGLVCAAAVLVVAGPVYLRNYRLTGTPLPMTRTLEPMRSGEARLFVRERQLGDYLAVPWDCGRYPYVVVVTDGAIWTGLNPAMQSVPCLAYAGSWFDPFGQRATRMDPAEGILLGVVLLYAGLVPSVLVGLGIALLIARTLRSRGRAPEAPLALHGALGVASFLAFTWHAPSLAAVKTSYLLPLLTTSGVAFALGCAALPVAVRRASIALSLAAAALALVVFTTGVAFAPARTDISLGYWTEKIGHALPGSYIAEAARRLLE